MTYTRKHDARSRPVLIPCGFRDETALEIFWKCNTCGHRCKTKAGILRHIVRRRQGVTVRKACYEE